MAVALINGDGTGGVSQQSVLAGSTAATAANLPAVVALHPTSPLPAGSNTIGAVTLGAGAAIEVTDGSGHNQPAMDTAARAGFTKVTDGTNTQAVKAASTAAGATDPSAVVGLSPNSPLPAGTNALGSVSVSSSALPTGAALDTSVAAVTTSLGTDGVGETPANGTGVRGWLRSIFDKLSGSIAVTGTFFQTTQPVSGTVTSNQGTANTIGNAWLHKLTDGTNTQTIDSDGAANVTIQGSNSSTLSNVAANASNVTLLSSNSARDTASFYNDSVSANAYLKLGATASLTSFTVKIFPGELYELPLPAYTGQIDCIWDAAVGTMRVTEQQ